MNNFLIYSVILFISIFINGCGGKKNPDPDSMTDQIETKIQKTDIPSMLADSVETVQTAYL